MGVGDYVLDKQKPPPILTKALNYEKWGIGDIMQLPAGQLNAMNLALFYYHALRGYRAATHKTVEWSKRNPNAWEAVTYIIAQRKERKRGNRNQ